MRKDMPIELARQAGGYICPDDPGEYGQKYRRGSIGDTEGHLLASMAEGLAVLEIGTGLGYSTRYLADTAERVCTVDIDPWVHENIHPYLPSNVYPMKELPEPALDWDMAFVDGNHHALAVVEDVAACLERVRPGGTIVFHDYSFGSVREGLVRAGISRQVEKREDTEFGLAIYRVPA